MNLSLTRATANRPVGCTFCSNVVEAGEIFWRGFKEGEDDVFSICTDHIPINTSTLVQEEPFGERPWNTLRSDCLHLAENAIFAVAADWRAVYRLNADEFEELVCDRLVAMGVQAFRTGRANQKDGGIDIFFWTPAPFRCLGVVQVIDAADGFLCDLTYVATTQAEKQDDDDFEPRYCSNPNVLFELGYAFRSMGYQRLICVMNENYGPTAEQIFDLAHRRFPFAYRFPQEGKSRSVVRAELATNIATAIRQMFPLGRKAELTETTRAPEIRSTFEAQVRDGTFHKLNRRTGAVAVSIVPGTGKRYDPQTLREQNLRPLVKNSWNPEIRGKSCLSVATQDDNRIAITSLQDDGVILAAESWMLDPAYHPSKELIVPAGALESALIKSTTAYLKSLKKLQAPLPWVISISLLDVKNYWFLISNSEASSSPYPERHVLAEPLTVRSISEIDSEEKIATFLRPAIDFIWREFGADGSYSYTESGTYNRRFY